MIVYSVTFAQYAFANASFRLVQGLRPYILSSNVEPQSVCPLVIEHARENSPEYGTAIALARVGNHEALEDEQPSDLSIAVYCNDPASLEFIVAVKHGIECIGFSKKGDTNWEQQEASEKYHSTIARKDPFKKLSQRPGCKKHYTQYDHAESEPPPRCR